MFSLRKKSLLRGQNFFCRKMFSTSEKSLYSEDKTFFCGNMFSTTEKSLYSEEKTFFRGNMFSTAEKNLYSEEKTFSHGNMFSTAEKSLYSKEKTFFHGKKSEKNFSPWKYVLFYSIFSLQQHPEQGRTAAAPLYWQAYMWHISTEKSFLRGVKTFFRGVKTFPQRKILFCSEK